ncbi:DUF1361 domain-containing protein [Microbacterium sp. SORGH_AS_0888]|uniref:DUF1361 domain-containing protein n=1 Tax=Microbacterium sp. SORGH_AS_0888 TaxID=3041791 RepID=UPI002789C848|nr:DUF1361 domain-containing protein [Microbacterium sp. SORGH_AS_0888]MDQ1130814.1 putative membrane protein [Microbacterium sp. SORGH_AS_0888]
MTILVAAAAVVLLNLYAAVLVWLRSAVYGVRLYRPMLVNIGLSAVPVLAAVLAVAGLAVLGPVVAVAANLSTGLSAGILWTYLVVGTLLWLLFFPNSIYLITELNFSHRQDGDPVPLWYDIVQTLTLTLSGIANAVLSLAVIQTGFVLVVVDPTPWVVPPASSWAFAAVVIVLGAVGVYLGRYLRFNSWDVRHPRSMASKLVSHLRQRGKALEAGGFVLTHALLIALVYAPLYLFGFVSLG